MTEGEFCTNLSSQGRRMRTRASYVGFAICVVTFAALVGSGASGPTRLLVGLPVMGTMVTWLQVRRHTCVRLAGTGQREIEGGGLEKVDTAIAEASKRVARTIYRDASFVGIAAALVSAATVLVR